MLTVLLIIIWWYYSVATPPTLDHVFKTEMKFLWSAVSHSVHTSCACGIYAWSWNWEIFWSTHAFGSIANVRQCIGWGWCVISNILINDKHYICHLKKIFSKSNFGKFTKSYDCSAIHVCTISYCWRDDNCCMNEFSTVSTRIWDNPYQNQIRLSKGAYTSQGLVEVYCNGQWGTVCDDLFGQTEANTVCKQLGYTGAARYDNLTPWVVIL